jgi:hypothetical protein
VHVTLRVRINWPIPAVRLLDAVTFAVGGDPRTVRRTEAHPCDIYGMDRISNEPDQDLAALAQVLWTEQPDNGWPDEPEPPALVILTASAPGVLEPPRWIDLRQLHDSGVLPVIRDWLDTHHVPRTSWWWSCEQLGYFPGTIDIAALGHPPDLSTLSHQAQWTPPATT